MTGMYGLLADLMHGGLQIFGASVAAYWTVRLAIRHELGRRRGGDA